MDKNEMTAFKVGDMVRTKKMRGGMRLCQNTVPHYSRCPSCCLFGKKAFKVIEVNRDKVMLEFRTNPKCGVKSLWQSSCTIEKVYKWVRIK